MEQEGKMSKSMDKRIASQLKGKIDDILDIFTSSGFYGKKHEANIKETKQAILKLFKEKDEEIEILKRGFEAVGEQLKEKEGKIAKFIYEEETELKRYLT